MDYLKFDEAKLMKVAKASGCSIQFKDTKDKEWTQGFVTDDSTGLSLGRITVQFGSFSHIKWYKNSYHSLLATLLQEISTTIKEANEAILKLNQRETEIALMRDKNAEERPKKSFVVKLLKLVHLKLLNIM